MSEKLTAKQYTEIAALAFFVALISWLLHHSMKSAYGTPPGVMVVPGTNTTGTNTNGPVITVSVPEPIGKTSGQSPADVSGLPNSCGCTALPTSVEEIYAIGNAGIAYMRQASAETMRYLASIGNQEMQSMGGEGGYRFV